MVLIADDSPYLVRAMQKAITISLAGIATLVKEQAGRGLRNADGNGIEHNGYADGVSQPLFFASDIQDENANGIRHDHWQPEAPLSLALVREKRASVSGIEPESYGSYLVFRKLEQNVNAFKSKEKELADALFGVGHTEEQGELAGAMVVGRYENGTPLALDGVSKPVEKDGIPNDYTFKSPNDDAFVKPDKGGTRCPFHAHTRKNNPRTDGAGQAVNKTHRIVRRGIPYEDVPRKRLSDGTIDNAELPTGDVGLLFMCFQSNISEQFEFIQRAWANNEGFEHPGVGIGPIVGESAPGAQVSPQKWPLIYNDPRNSPVTAPFLFKDVTKMLGGGYFFAPSLSFLTGLSETTALNPSLQIFSNLDPFPAA